MNLIVALLLGALVGRVASALMFRRRGEIVINVGLGMAGALLGALLLGSLYGSPILAPYFSGVSLLLALVGAVIFVAVGTLFRRAYRPRRPDRAAERERLHFHG